MHAIINDNDNVYLCKRGKFVKRNYVQTFVNKEDGVAAFDIICKLWGDFAYNKALSFDNLLMDGREMRGMQLYPTRSNIHDIEALPTKCSTKQCNVKVFVKSLVNKKRKYICLNCIDNKYVMLGGGIVDRKRTVCINRNTYLKKELMNHNDLSYCKKCSAFYHIGSGCICYTGVEDYGRTSGKHFYKTSKENVDNRYYGIEHELSGGDSDMDDRQTCSAMLGRYFRELITKEDGSVSGFEVCFQPMTLSYIQQLDWSKYINILKKHYLVHTAECGLHIHVNRASISKVLLYKVFRFFKSNLSDIYTLSERKIERLEEWSGWGYENGIMQTIYDSHHHNRYVMINLQNTQTVEFRFFNGTIVGDKILGRVEVIASLLEYLERHSIKDINNFNNYINFVLECQAKYPKAKKLLTRLFLANSI